MNIIDILCLVILAAWCIVGAKKGLLHGILRVIVMLVCLLAAYLFYPYVSNTVGSFVKHSAGLERAVFVGIFLFVTISINSVGGRFLDTIGSSNRLSTPNRIVGALIGGLQGIFYLAAGLILLSAVLGSGKLKDMIDSGKVSTKITQSVAISYGTIDKIIRKTGINPFVNEVKELIEDNE